MTVRDMVRAAQADLLRDNVTPVEVRNHLMTVTAIRGNVNKECRESELEYNAVLLRHLEGAEKANRATIRARTSPEYARFLEAKNIRDEVEAARRALSKCLDSLSEEMRGERWAP